MMQANWIWCKGGCWCPTNSSSAAYRTCYFRRTFEVSRTTAQLIVHVSADSRYVLYLNSEVVSRGPAKGDIRHHFYDTVDLSARLKVGKNVLAAQVVSYAPVWSAYQHGGAPTSVMTITNAFFLDGKLINQDGVSDVNLSTDRSWKVLPDQAYSQIVDPPVDTLTGMGEDLEGEKYPWGWSDLDYNDQNWEPAVELAQAETNETVNDSNLPYRLIPRMIPPLEEVDKPFSTIYQVQNVDTQKVLKLIKDQQALQIPSNSQVSFILDVEELTTGFPIIKMQGGKGSVITLTYSEAWHVNGKKSIHHLPDKGKIIGVYDKYSCSNGDQKYEPFHWRTFRYILVEIKTADEPLILTELFFSFIRYPYQLQASFSSSDSRHKKIFDISWRTIQLCSHETFEDCPYYEQLQYAGDVHVVMLYAGYASGDWQLARQALCQFNWSRGYDGLTQSRYPSRVPQYIPSWSLMWILAVRDYWWHTGDTQTPQSCLDGIKSVLGWFSRFHNKEGLLESLPFWKVVDWVKEWPMGCPPGAEKGISAVINLQYSAALQAAEELFQYFECSAEGDLYRQQAQVVNEAINQKCWNEKLGIYLDCPDEPDKASELGNAWAILAGAATGNRLFRVGQRLSEVNTLAKATLYGRFYVFRALRQAGFYSKAGSLLDLWYFMMKSDLTTWPEEPYLARSFCHAWSASPIYEFLAETLGVKPMSPGFKQIAVVPQMNDLSWAKGSVPIAGGVVNVEWRRDKNEFQIILNGPTGIEMTLVLPDGSVEKIVSQGVSVTRSCNLSSPAQVWSSNQNMLYKKSVTL